MIEISQAFATAIAQHSAFLDYKKFDLWLDGFHDESSYDVTTKYNIENGFPAGLIHCQTKGQLRDRILSIARVNVYPPQSYRHILSTSIVSDRQSEIVTPFVCYLVSPNSDTILFASGEYIDVWIDDAESRLGFRITERTVVLDSDRIDTALAIPL